MGSFYGCKIRRGETNPNTAEVWKLADVPSYWRAATEKWLMTNP